MRTQGQPPVVVHGHGITVDRVGVDVPAEVARAEAHDRAGGLDLPASAGGALAGLGAVALLGALLHRLDLPGTAVAVAALAGSAPVGALAGWVTGRSCRYQGARNGLLAGALTIVLTCAVGLLVSGPDDLDANGRPLALLLAAALCLAAAALGGSLGARWHRSADDALARTRLGGVAPYPVEERP